MNDSPLGKPTRYPNGYSPEILVAIPRSAARAPLNIGEPLPFNGVDIWNAWEFTWLDGNGKPWIATAEIRVPADTANLVESKSLKLYLNGFALTTYPTVESVRKVIGDDLSRVVAGPVEVSLSLGAPAGSHIDIFPGDCLDDLSIAIAKHSGGVDATSLRSDDQHTVEESLHTHLLRSLCPVTGQPDIGSLMIRYRGAAIDRAGLLRYVVSFRQHSDFHEACIERIFKDIQDRCGCVALTVYARYCRRGGIDINPYRSNTDELPQNLRLWRQ